MTKLEDIYRETHRISRGEATIISANERKYGELAVRARDAKLDLVIARLELIRHQRNHIKPMGPGIEATPSSSAVAA